MAKFHIDKGLEANLPTSDMVEEGHVYVTLDKGNMYFAPSDNGILVPLNRSPYYLTCATAAGTQTKSATLPDGELLPNTLRAGVFVVVRFSASNTATSPSLKITDGFGRVYGPIAIKEYGSTAVGSTASLSWQAGEAVPFVYDGSNWMRLSHMAQPDWNQVNTTAADYVKNKPSIVKGSGSLSIQEGNNTSAVGSYSHAQNNGTKAIGANSHAEGANTVAVGLYSHAEGACAATAISGVSGGAGTSTTIYSTSAAHGLSVGNIVEHNGTYTTVSNIVNPRLFMVSETLGELSSATINLVKGVAYKRGSHVEGRECIATGEYAHAEGYDTEAGANYTHAEGYGTKAIGLYAHSEGRDTEASGAWSHAEGRNTVASGNYAHAEGRNTTAGSHSHSEGYYTTANCISYGAHAEGANTVTNNDCEHAEGRFNSSRQNITTFGDGGNTIHSVGIGTSENTRKNAVEVMQNGDIYIDRVGNYNGSGTAKTLQRVLYDGPLDTVMELNVSVQTDIPSKCLCRLGKGVEGRPVLFPLVAYAEQSVSKQIVKAEHLLPAKLYYYDGVALSDTSLMGTGTVYKVRLHSAYSEADIRWDSEGLNLSQSSFVPQSVQTLYIPVFYNHKYCTWGVLDETSNPWYKPHGEEKLLYTEDEVVAGYYYVRVGYSNNNTLSDWYIMQLTEDNPVYFRAEGEQNDFWVDAFYYYLANE